MRSLRNLWFQAHWLVGIVVGLILLIVGITGALLAFEQQLLTALNSQARTVVPSGARLSPPELLRRIEQEARTGRITALSVSSDPAAAVRVTIAAAGAGAAREQTRYVDPYTATWHVEGGTRGEAFFRSTRDLHRWLMIAGSGDRDAGRQIIGASTLLLIALALSGLYLRWPKRISNWRAWCVVNTRLRGRGFLWSLHSVIGTFALIPFLFLALTGLYWSYGWYRAALYELAGVEQSADAVAPQGVRASPAAMSHAWAAFERESRPSGYSVVQIRLPGAAGAHIQFRYLDPQPAHNRAYNVLIADPQTGAALGHERYADKRLGERLVSSMFALHTGSFFGVAGSALLMLASLTLPVSAVTGWMMYLERRRIRIRAKVAASP